MTSTLTTPLVKIACYTIASAPPTLPELANCVQSHASFTSRSNFKLSWSSIPSSALLQSLKLFSNIFQCALRLFFGFRKFLGKFLVSCQDRLLPLFFQMLHFLLMLLSCTQNIFFHQPTGLCVDKRESLNANLPLNLQCQQTSSAKRLLKDSIPDSRLPE